MRRRSVLICLAATTAAAVAHNPAMAAIATPRFPCGCASKRPILEFDGCLVHDETGKRWDAYTLDEIAAMNRDEITVVGKDDEITCYGGYCPDHDVLPVGTRGVWRRTSYEYDEWEFKCARCEREEWLSCQTTDWRAMAEELGP